MKKLLLILVLTFNSYASVDHDQFLKLKDALALAFEELRPDSDHTLSINPLYGLAENYWWDIDMVHASYSRLDMTHNIFLFGGFARLEGMTLDGLALTACHEIGHGIGGAPYKTSGSSSEGQSDYYATTVCLPVVFKYLIQEDINTETPFNLDFCKESENFEYCLRALTALESDIYFFKTSGEIVSFDTPSLDIAMILDDSPTYYPSAQCRIDTMLNGVLGKPRPTCWFPKK